MPRSKRRARRKMPHDGTQSPEEAANRALPEASMAQEPVWRCLYWMLAAAFCVRAAVALSGDFVLHPDEIMQYLEPAHRVVFGNGITLWEFFYGARSWLVPGFVAGILRFCQGVGLSEPALYIAAVKLAFCAVSLAIPAGMYFAGRRLYGEPTGRIALVLGSFWYELVGFAHKPMTEFIATALLLALLAWTLRPATPRRAAASAAMATLLVAVRYQYAVLAGVLLAWDFVRSGKRARGAAVLAGLAVLGAIGAFEYVTWGRWFQSYWLNFEFNLLFDRSQDPTTVWSYLGWLALASGGAVLAALAAGIGNWRRHALVLALTLAVLLPHLPLDHREYRFIFVFIPLWLLLFADLLATGWQARQTVAHAFRHWRPLLGLGYAAALSGVGILNAIPGQHHIYAGYSGGTEATQFVRDQDPHFAFYRHLAQDASLCGVLDAARDWHNTPGYYYLHQPVPFYINRHIGRIFADDVHRYVTHIITDIPLARRSILRAPDGTTAVRIGGRIRTLPAVMVDTRSRQLAYMDKQGDITAIDGFALARNIGGTTLWVSQRRAEPAQACQTYAWPSYHRIVDIPQAYEIVRAILGDGVAAPDGTFRFLKRQ